MLLVETDSQRKRRDRGSCREKSRLKRLRPRLSGSPPTEAPTPASASERASAKASTSPPTPTLAAIPTASAEETPAPTSRPPVLEQPGRDQPVCRWEVLEMILDMKVTSHKGMGTRWSSSIELPSFSLLFSYPRRRLRQEEAPRAHPHLRAALVYPL